MFESAFVASVMVGMFIALARGWYSPEVVVSRVIRTSACICLSDKAFTSREGC